MMMNMSRSGPQIGRGNPQRNSNQSAQDLPTISLVGNAVPALGIIAALIFRHKLEASLYL